MFSRFEKSSISSKHGLLEVNSDRNQNNMYILNTVKKMTFTDFAFNGVLLSCPRKINVWLTEHMLMSSVLKSF